MQTECLAKVAKYDVSPMQRAPAKDSFGSGSNAAAGGKFTAWLEQAERRDAVTHRPTIAARVNDEATLGREVFAGGMEAAFDPGREASFDLDRPQRAVGPRDEQVELRTAGCSVEVTRRRANGVAACSTTSPSKLGPTTGWPSKASRFEIPSSA